MPSADMWSNRCVPLRGTSAGYASASSAFIWLLKSSRLEGLPRGCVACRLDELNLPHGNNSSQYRSVINFSRPQKICTSPWRDVVWVMAF